jgi:putative intracellular protease/amidase
MKDANIPREQKWREQVRHWASYPVALVVSGVSGAIGTAVASVADAFVAAICHAPVVMGAGLAVFVITFLVKAYQYSQTTQALNGNIVGSILGWSVLWAVGAGLVAGLGQAAYLYGKRLKEQKRAEEGWG